MPSKTPPTDELASLKGQLRQAQHQYRAVAQYLWSLVQEKCPTGEIKLRTDTIDPLWSLVFLQVEDEKGEIDQSRIHILAGTKPAMTEQEKKRMVRRLKNTPDRDLQAVLKELKLGEREFPSLYVEQMISDRIKWDLTAKTWAPVPAAPEDAPEFTD